MLRTVKNKTTEHPITLIKVRCSKDQDPTYVGLIAYGHRLSKYMEDIEAIQSAIEYQFDPYVPDSVSEIIGIVMNAVRVSHSNTVEEDTIAIEESHPEFQKFLKRVPITAYPMDYDIIFSPRMIQAWEKHRASNVVVIDPFEKKMTVTSYYGQMPKRTTSSCCRYVAEEE